MYVPGKLHRGAPTLCAQLGYMLKPRSDLFLDIDLDIAIDTDIDIDMYMYTVYTHKQINNYWSVLLKPALGACTGVPTRLPRGSDFSRGGRGGCWALGPVRFRILALKILWLEFTV